MIIVYPFKEAPRHLQELSTNGGDEDWLAVMSRHFADNTYVPWMEGSDFGCCCVDRYELNDQVIYIGSHA